jgi:hypothetical protein
MSLRFTTHEVRPSARRARRGIYGRMRRKGINFIVRQRFANGRNGTNCPNRPLVWPLFSTEQRQERNRLYCVDYPEGCFRAGKRRIPRTRVIVAIQLSWACGAVGSALPWHGRGREFESHQVHQNISNRWRFISPLQVRAGVQNIDASCGQLRSSQVLTVGWPTGFRPCFFSAALSSYKKPDKTRHLRWRSLSKTAAGPGKCNRLARELERFLREHGTGADGSSRN